MSFEGLADKLGRECRQLISIKNNVIEFSGVDIPEFQGFSIDIGEIKAQSKNSQKVEQFVLALDTLQFMNCQRRKKWMERLEKEKNAEIRLEITRKILESEEESSQIFLEIFKVLKKTKGVTEEESMADIDSKMDNILFG